MYSRKERENSDEEKKPTKKRSRFTTATMLENSNLDQKKSERKEKEQLKKFLFKAIRSKNIEKVRVFLENNREGIKEVINQSFEGFNFIHLATSSNDLEIARLLLDLGANPTEKDEDNENCFHRAALRGNLEMLKLLADYIEDKEELKNAINVHNIFDYSVLHRVAAGIVKRTEEGRGVSNKDWEIVKWLLEQGADPDYVVNNEDEKNYSVEEAISQSQDNTYGEKYLKIVEEFKKKQEELREKNKKEIFFWKVIKGDDKETIAKLNTNIRKKREEYLKTEEEFAELKRQLRLVKEKMMSQKKFLIEELEANKTKESERELVANIEVLPEAL